MPRVLLALLFTASAFAQAPQIFYRGILNAASFAPPGLPNGGIARGSIFSIFGKRLGPAQSPELAFPLGTTLGGVTVTIAQGSTTVNAIPIFVGPGQINAILPSNTPLGMASLRVRVNNSQSNPVPVRVVETSFGIFSARGSGNGPAIVQNFVSATAQPVNALNAAATRGQVVTIWGTGLGAAPFADNIAPPAQNLNVPVEVQIGGKGAEILYSGRSPCCSGVDQIVVKVPDDAPLGCWVPISVRTGASSISNFGTMAIATGSSCSEPGNPLAAALISGGKIVNAAAARVSTQQDVGVARPGEVVGDWAGAFLAEETAGPFGFNPMFSLPPAGACTSYTVNGIFPRDVPLMPGMTPSSKALVSGLLSLAGPKGSKTVPAAAAPLTGFSVAPLGGVVKQASSIPDRSFLDAGSYTLTSPAANDVGAINAQTAIPQPLTWTNRSSIASVDRTKPLTVQWSGGHAGGTVFIAGGGADIPTNSTALFLCIAAPGATSFTVPANALANIPPTRPIAMQSLGGIYVGEWNFSNPAQFSASGLNFGNLTWAGISGKTVAFQ